MVMYINAAVRLNIGTRETIHKCEQKPIQMDEVTTFYSEYTKLKAGFDKGTLLEPSEERYKELDGRIYCFCKSFGFMEVYNGGEQLQEYCQSFKNANLIKSITIYLVPIMIILSNNFYKFLIVTLVRIFPFKESSKELFIKTLLFLIVGFNELVGINPFP
jgi:hypothetical protein